MPKNVWCIREKAKAPMYSFTSNFSLEQYVWTLLDVPDETSEEEVAMQPQIPRPKMLVRVDEYVILIPVILMGHPQPPCEEEPCQPQPPQQPP